MPARIEFTQEQLDRMKELYESGTNLHEIARTFGVSRWTITRLLREIDVKIKPPGWAVRERAFSQRQMDTIRELYESGLSLQMIADKFNTSRDTISKCLCKMSIEIRSPWEWATTKFAEHERDEIKELYHSGLGAPQIGKKFGVSHVPIYRLLREMDVEVRPAGNSNAMGFSDVELNMMKESYGSGMSSYQIAEMFNVSPTTVLRRLREMSVKIRLGGNIAAGANDHFFDDLSGERPAYWLGLLFADGCIKDKKEQKGLSLTQSIGSAELVEQFAQDIEYEGNLHYHTDKDGCSSVRVEITSNPLCNKLIALGVTPRKSLTIQFPTEVPRETMRHFLRGYIDGDGSLGFSRGQGTIQIPSGSRQFLVGFKRALMDLLPHINDNKICKIKDKNCHIVRWGGNRQCARIARLLYGDCSIALTYKCDVAQQMMAMG